VTTNRSKNETTIPSYVVDTEALYLYLRDARRLSPAADAVFRLAESGNALLVVPAIAVAELQDLTGRYGRALPISRLLADLSSAPEFSVAETGAAQLAALERVPQEVRGLRARLLAAEALLRNAPIVTTNEDLRRSRAIATIW
jgi:hypothetical protein